MEDFISLEVIITLAIVYIFIKYVLVDLFKKDPVKIGKKGERAVSKILSRAFHSIPHYQYDDVLIEHENDITQIDHIVISTKGIFVIETKNMEGWIFGNERQRNWTQSLYGNNFKFVNPLKQNYRHVKILQHSLGFGEKYFESVIVFSGFAELKTEVPFNVIYSYELLNYLRRRHVIQIEDQQLLKCKANLEAKIIENTKVNRKRHLHHINRRMNK